jgi:hypothetical protein
MVGIEIKLVETKKDLKTFIGLVPALYKDDPKYIQPLDIERMEALDWEKNPYFDHAEVAFWVAYQNDKPVGRISAQCCELYADQINPDMGQFGLFECINDRHISHVLFQTAANWLRDRDKTGMEGPYNLSINQECGLLVEGFDTPPMIMMGHALPYYQNLYELEGLAKVKDLYAYSLDMQLPRNERITKITEFARRNKNFHVRPLNKKKIDEELEIIFDIFNDAWSDNWGFIPFTPDEAKAVTKEMKPILFKEQAYILEYKGEPAAFMVIIPNINHAIRDFKGKLLPFNWAKLAWRIFGPFPDEWRCPLMGVRKKYRNTRTGAMMPLLVCEKCRDTTAHKGGKMIEMSWILEDNTNMRDILVEWGGEIYKTYRIFNKIF